ncbi:MAG: hydroxyacylglutathione hydrolase [Pseudomonadota bacterium]|nr:hydroxyacylglutathione hydrolase [Pseudomonadota bacterium]
MSTLSIDLVPCLSDNYAYLITDAVQGLCAVVDPSEAGPVRERLRARSAKLTHILNTHHHPDHTGGNLELKEAFGAPVVGPEKDRARIPGLDVGVGEEAPWQFGSKPVAILEIPAHTSGHIAFIFREDKAAFTGDTLFAMGCGRLFEGTPAMMWAAMQKLMALPDDMRVYCGHEYTLSNARFALTLEPDNAALQARMREVTELRAKGLPTIPTTIGLEKRTNPFMRPDSPELRRTLGMEKANDVDVLAETRRRKDNF